MKTHLVAILFLFFGIVKGEEEENLNSISPEPNSRVVGGSNARGPVPYQVSFQIKNRAFDVAALSIQEWAHFCGGSIISENHVLTAAHCVVQLTPSRFTIYSGSKVRTQGGTRHTVDKIFVHPNYEELVQSDIAVVKVKEPFNFDGENTDKIDYTNRERIGGGVPVTLTGWGFSYPIPLLIPFIDTLPNNLQEINYTTITNEECQNAGFNVTDTEICAYGRVLKGACSGDSGGPLVNLDKTMQIGVVSYGTQICSSGVPDAYTRVSEFVDWITEQMQK
ncbi:chymotrypsin-2-like [Condylostylus longicornis]|uniref:chymotrypsin-2-like n=1 Tax=Condylostylus longicornis TaxID=2530218 RepID=UPI00244DA400|nr:chymotrypsin-2-like [Condylostylus longicornis]